MRIQTALTLPQAGRAHLRLALLSPATIAEPYEPPRFRLRLRVTAHRSYPPASHHTAPPASNHRLPSRPVGLAASALTGLTPIRAGLVSSVVRLFADGASARRSSRRRAAGLPMLRWPHPPLCLASNRRLAFATISSRPRVCPQVAELPQPASAADFRPCRVARLRLRIASPRRPAMAEPPAPGQSRAVASATSLQVTTGFRLCFGRRRGYFASRLSRHRALPPIRVTVTPALLRLLRPRPEPPATSTPSSAGRALSPRLPSIRRHPRTSRPVDLFRLQTVSALRRAALTLLTRCGHGPACRLTSAASHHRRCRLSRRGSLTRLCHGCALSRASLLPLLWWAASTPLAPPTHSRNSGQVPD